KMGYDSLIERVGSFGLFQKRLFVLFFLNGIPNGLLITSIVFLHFVPTHRCKLPFYERQYNQDNMSLLRHRRTDVVSGIFPRCRLINCWVTNYLENPSFNYSEGAIPEVDNVKCYNGYDYVSDTGIKSAMMEFDVVCENAWIKPLISSLFFVGIAIGTLSGSISDRFGRRPVFLAFTFIQFFSVFCTSFPPDITTYGVLFVLCGLSQTINFMCAFIIGAEFTTPDRRNFLSISSFVSYSVGYLIGPFFSYFIPNWRWLMRLNGLIGILYIPYQLTLNLNNYFRLIPESPRWLLSNGKRKTAITVLEQVAQMNNCAVNQQEEIETILVRFIFFVWVFITHIAHFLNNLKNFKCRMSIAIVYFGISLSVDTLSGDIFINCFLMGLIEIPGLIAAFMGVKYCSRSYAHSGFMFISGFACLLAALFKNVYPTVTLMFALIGKTANAGVFYIVFVHTAEIVPTNVRHFYMCAGSFAGRVGSVIAPFFGYAGKFELFGVFAPYLILSGVVLTSALMTLLFLPNTHLKRLPESIADVLKM
uniref:Major facilitator superfamily (MFS) profile domain-containing protein n=1 Tax=Ciona savignyi TaxID=51511 RepID=H2ZB65_CIOSA